MKGGGWPLFTVTPSVLCDPLYLKLPCLFTGGLLGDPVQFIFLFVVVCRGGLLGYPVRFISVSLSYLLDRLR